MKSAGVYVPRGKRAPYTQRSLRQTDAQVGKGPAEIQVRGSYTGTAYEQYPIALRVSLQALPFGARQFGGVDTMGCASAALPSSLAAAGRTSSLSSFSTTHPLPRPMAEASKSPRPILEKPPV